MIQYILECIAFQLVFLIIYDLFLKRETFFQWNRFYLIGTYIISMVLPWMKIEAMKTTVPKAFQAYPEFLWSTNDVAVTAIATEETSFHISWEYALLFGGMFLATLFFGHKLLQIYTLKRKGEVQYFKDFTQIIISNSAIAFSFFKSIFLGDKVLANEHENILQHELVHIRQRHSYDLMFFELMRVVGWFNPLVYVYQSRVSELHEFIADAQVAKTDKKEQYEFLLSQVFQTQNISFINQFFKSSLIKKRIVMLTKEKSKQVFKLKYVLLIPILIGMLFYTSCDLNELKGDANEVETIVVDDIENLTAEEEGKAFSRLMEISKEQGEWSFIVKDKKTTVTFSKPPEGSFISGSNGIPLKAKMHVESQVLGDDFDFFNYKATHEMMRKGNASDFPFSMVEEVPIFPGCENEANKRACFNKMIQRHISKNFRYPQKAQELGIQGRVSTMFTIAEDGSIQNVRMRGPDSLLENEVDRIIRRLPKMVPGRQDGKAVRVPFSIPVSFKLEQSNFSMNSPSASLSKQHEMLVHERQRLLDASDATTPIIKQLDEQIIGLKKAIDWNALKESESITNSLFKGIYKDIISFSKVDEAPAFPDCGDDLDKRACFQKSIQRHISKNFRYPQEAQQKGIQGRVAVLFIIAEDGAIKNIKLRGPDKLLEEEAERIIERLPKMIPGKHKGKLVDVAFSIPITFKLK